MKTSFCAWCGREFSHERSTAMYCSASHKQLASKHRTFEIDSKMSTAWRHIFDLKHPIEQSSPEFLAGNLGEIESAISVIRSEIADLEMVLARRLS